MDFDLEHLRLDIPEEDFSEEPGASRVWKYITFLLVIALAGVGYLYYEQAQQADGPRVISVRTHAVALAVTTGEASFTAGGWIEPAWPYPVIVSSLIDGRIEELSVVEGQEVTEGDIIATLYEIDIEREIELAEAEIAALDARLSLLEAGTRSEAIDLANAAKARAEARLALLEAGYRKENIALAEARLTEAETDEAFLKEVSERSAELLAKGAISKEDASRDAAAYKRAQSRTRAAEQEVKRLKAGPREEEIDEAKASIAEALAKVRLLEAGYRKEEIEAAKAAVTAAQVKLAALEAKLEYCEILAPTDGIVLEILTPQGGTVTAKGKGIVTIYDPTDMQVRVDVRQEQAAALFIGQNAQIKIEARSGQPYGGEVIRIDPLANLARDTVRAKVQFDAPDEFLRTNMTVTVDFLKEAEFDPDKDLPLILPRTAISARDGKDYVFVISGGAAEMREVKLGRKVRAGFEVLEGVVNGDIVAISNVDVLQDKTIVQIEAAATEE